MSTEQTLREDLRHSLECVSEIAKCYKCDSCAGNADSLTHYLNAALALPRSEPSPDDLARRFHEAYERLAPSFGYETRRESAKPWANVPAQNKALMIAVCAELCLPSPAVLNAADALESWLNEDSELRSAEVLIGEVLRWCVRLKQIIFEEPGEITVAQAEDGSLDEAVFTALRAARGAEASNA